MRKIWPFTFNFLLYAAFAFVAPYIVLYYQGLGFTGTQIGLLTGIVPLITLFSSPLWTGLADATHRHRLLMGDNDSRFPLSECIRASFRDRCSTLHLCGACYALGQQRYHVHAG
jgi:hypothetical protein